MSKKKIHSVVYEFRKEYELKEVNVRSLSLVIARLGYVLVEFSTASNDSNTSQLIDALNLSEQIQSQRGFTYADGEMRIVFINEALSDDEKLIVLSHELGHIVLGHFHKSNIIGNDVTDEFEANEFSSCLIKPSASQKAFYYLTTHKKPVAIATGGIAALAISAVAVGALLPKESSSYANNASSNFINSEEGQSLPEELLAEGTLAEDEVIETSVETDPVTGETHVVYTRVLKSETTNSESAAASESSSTSKSTTASTNSSKATKTTKAAAETTSAPLVTENKYYMIDDIPMYYSESVRGGILDDLIWNKYNGKTTPYSSYTFSATNDGGLINVYLNSDNLNNDTDLINVLKTITTSANDFSKQEPAWTRTNYYAYVYSGDSSQRLLCKILNGTVVYSE